MGGVIVNLNSEICISNYKELAGFDVIEDYLDKYHQKGFISDFEEGKMDERGFYDECLRRSRPGTTDETLKECMCSLLHGLFPETLDLIKELNGKYDLYILSNNNPIARAKFASLMKEAGMDTGDYFKKEFYSYEMHLLKPGREIFETAVKEIGLKPEEVLFIDDSKTNAEGARATGINTIWLKPGASIREEVMRILDNQ